MRIGVYGGTFDPPHNGHIAAAQAAVGQLKLGSLLLIPAGFPPHKELPEDVPDTSLRLEMTRIAARHIPGAQVSDMEIRRSGPSYTADTLEELKEEFPEGEFVLLMGADMFLSLEKWRRYRDILRLATIGTFAREDGQDEELEKFAGYLSNTYGACIDLVCHAPVEVSSSELREMLPHRLGRGYFPDDLYTCIIKNRLYGAKPEFEWLRDKAYAMLEPQRVAHVQGCEEEAAKLATRWGVDAGDAREAAILHDITKNLGLNEQLHFCEKYGIMTDNAEKQDRKLLHAKTGAAAAKVLFGSPDSICHAILWHTTGRADMTPLEKIIYLADYIEPTRDFEGLDKLRELAYSDLDAALLLGFEMSISDLHERGICPHKRTQEAMAWLQQKKT